MSQVRVPAPMTGAALIRFALDVVDLLRRAEPFGFDQSAFLRAYFTGNPPATIQLQNHWWSEFKRAADYSNVHFNRNEDGWAFIRAMPGAIRGQYFYHAVAILDQGRIDYIEAPATAVDLEDFTTRRWLTQTRSRMRVRAAEAMTLITEGRRTGNAQLEARGQNILDEFIMLSPRLAAINFDSGMVTSDLRQLANSPNQRIQRLVGNRIRRALATSQRLERDINALAEQVLRIARVYHSGSSTTMP
jgi:hypothetical protein